MKTCVIDASVVVDALTGVGKRSGAAREAMVSFDEWLAPHILDSECLGAWRAMVVRGILDLDLADLAADELLHAAVGRLGTWHLSQRIRELWANISPSDASYIALAEEHNVPLLTADARLARAPGPRCDIVLVGA